jgi:hypothetical protein
MKAEAHISTGRASHYIKVLCRHFREKVPAEYSEARGDVQFPFGTCEMLAHPEELVLRVQAEDTEQFDRVKAVVGGHLEEFAYRGETIAVEWKEIP